MGPVETGVGLRTAGVATERLPSCFKGLSELQYFADFQNVDVTQDFSVEYSRAGHTLTNRQRYRRRTSFQWCASRPSGGH